ncbi:MAG: protein translocase subunit SecF [candidate division Zixibacteria bacterium]|nr:protein translocase subunit SecF [candidate division Zixibacteria bacterium]
MFRIIPDTNINFIGARKIAFGVSILLVALGLFAAVMIGTGRGNLGIDFAGGAMLQGHFAEPVAIDDLRGALTGTFDDVKVSTIKDFKLPNAFMIKTKRPETEGESKERVAVIKDIMVERFPGNTFAVDSEHIIGPAVGESLRKDAMFAILISLAGIIVYIWIRFDFRSGIAATVATFHDVLAVLGISYFAGIEFDLLIVTALLTLAGYSLTDTVVVYDRIRENLKKFRGRGEFVTSVNRSINEVLSRTFMTSGTTLLMVVTLAAVGGEVLRSFSIALILGVIIGTYSSVFVASPIIVEWEARRPRLFK